MKKFLTVLLALSVVFTYTVGTAFALPSDTGTSTEAGLAAAKAEAIQELKDYPNMSEYNATGQAKVKAIIAEYTDKINEAKKVGTTTDAEGDKSVFGYLNGGKAAINGVDKLSQLSAAKIAAVEQFNDYVYLIDTLNVPGIDQAVVDAKIGYTAYSGDGSASDKSFKTAAVAAINAAVDLDAVAKALSTNIEKADAVYAQLKSVEVPQAVIDELVKEIRAKAATKKVNTANYSAAVVNAYEAAIAQGVAAAKAVTNYDEYHKVHDKYLGATTSEATYANGNVIVHIEQVSVFDKLANKNLDAEKQIKAIEKVLSAIGEYNYKDIKSNEWDTAEKFYAEAKYFVENGEFNKLTSNVTEQALSALYGITSGNDAVSKDDTTAEVNSKVAAVVDKYESMTLLGAAKADLTAELEDYPANLNTADYSDADKTRIEALRATGANLINAATSVAAANDAYDTYIEKIDAIDTTTAAAFKTSIPVFNKAVDAYVAEHKAANLTADQETLITRFVKDIKAEYEADETKYINLEDATLAALTVNGGTTTLANVLAGKEYANGEGANAGYVVAKSGLYNAANNGIVDGIVAAFNDETLDNITTWAGFFAAYDKAVTAIDAVPTKTQENYANAVLSAEAAIKALGTPALTTEFKKALDKAKTAVEAVADAYGALSAAEKAEAKALDTSAYDTAAFEYARLVYVDGLGTQAADPIAEVTAFNEIASDFLGTTINSYFSAAAKAEIAKIITDAYDAINAAKTDADKAAAALKGIEALDAVAVDGSGAAAELAEALATVKAEAAKYFTKYENASFTSDATTKLDLVKDIIEFNAKFSDAAAAEKEKQIADVKSFKIKTTTKRYTGSKMRVNWTVVEGNESAIDGYRIYYSTKKSNSGYKYLAKTTKKYINHTSIKKSVKKGTRVYYRVRAYAEIDGVRYFSDYSTVGNRIWK
ncbi:fibronectin type III domain-containing protein [Anaerovoracaceae bacterium 42-11]